MDRGVGALVDADGDEAAYVEFCAREFPRLVGALGLYCGDPAVGEELAQEALLRAATNWSTVRRARSPAAWLRRVGMNLAHSYYRRVSAERRAVARLTERSEVAHHDADVVTGVTVRRAVSGLPRRQRRVVVLRFYLDLSVDQTADELGTTPGAVTALTSRAMRALRTRLDDHEHDHTGRTS